MSTPGSPNASTCTKTELVLPQHTNAIGTAFGGTIMSWIDITAAVSAQRHCGRVAVTASVDAIDFLAPIRLGDVVTLTARVHCVFRTSMEVFVLVERELPAATVSERNPERTVCARARLTFVNIDADGRAAPVPPLKLETETDHQNAASARARRDERLKRNLS